MATAGFFSSSNSTHARSTFTLVHKSVPLQSKGGSKDASGRFLIVQGRLLSVQLDFVHLYGPHNNRVNFLKNNLVLRISTLLLRTLIMSWTQDEIDLLD